MVQQSTIASSMNFVGQDGFGAGALSGVKINGDGTIEASFTNGTLNVKEFVAVITPPAAFVNDGSEPNVVFTQPDPVIVPSLRNGASRIRPGHD